MLNELNYEIVSESRLNTYYGKGADSTMGIVTAFAIIAVITIVIYKIYGSKSGDITLPGGFKFKFTS